MTTELDRLREVLSEIGPVAVAWSGGTDSSLLAKVARDTLGRGGAVAFTAVSPSLPADELDDCRSLAREWDLDWQVLHTDELDRPEYRRNAADRCAHCKHALLDVMAPVARVTDATICLGVIVDDLGDDRPGQEVAAGRGARFPLAEAGLDKAAVRRVSHELGLRTWDKPAAACLASRIPHGTEVTVALLGRVEKAEKALRELGFGLTEPLRVRHRGHRARVELAGAELARALADPAPVTAAVSSAGGYQEVELALEGYRSPT